MREGEHKGIFAQPAFYLGLMFLIITSQVFWWLMFFAGTRFALVRAQEDLDMVLLKALNGDTADLQPPPYFHRENGRYSVNRSVITDRRNERDRNLVMLWAEASFFIGVFGAGAVILTVLHGRQRRLARERELFLNSFTHELKTPLAAIKLNLQTLKRRPTTSSREELLETSLREVEILNRRISEILLGGSLAEDASRGPGEMGEAPKPQIEPGVSSLATHVLEKVLADLSSTIRETGGVVRSAWLPPVRGPIKSLFLTGPLPAPVFDGGTVADQGGVGVDPFRRLKELDAAPVRVGALELGFILSGLITNALMHGSSEQGAEISVWFRETERHLIIYIADRGPGIPWNQRRNIFRPLVRLQQKQGFLPGTGMGLFNLRELCRRRGGQVRLRPSSVGAVFEARLPLVKKEAAT